MDTMNGQNDTDSRKNRAFLTFGLEEGEFAVPAVCVREIVGLFPAAAPGDGESEAGNVITVGGRAVPVIDLRTVFELNERDISVIPCIIVVEPLKGGTCTETGIVVDYVQDVVRLALDDAEPVEKHPLSLIPVYSIGSAAGRGPEDESAVSNSVGKAVEMQKNRLTRHMKLKRRKVQCSRI